MSTRPKNDPNSIALDARRVHDAALADSKDKEFAKRLQKGELGQLLTEIEELEAGSGARGVRLASKVAAGVHVAQIRAAIWDVLAGVREDAHLAFPKDVALQHAFGVGLLASPGSTPQTRDAADSLLAAAEAHPKEAGLVGLDKHGIHDLETQIHALDGADLAHVHATTNRHTSTTHTDSLAHLVSAEVARLRRIAHRVWKSEPDKLAAYAHTLPRHEIKPRSHVSAPPAPVTK